MRKMPAIASSPPWPMSPYITAYVCVNVHDEETIQRKLNKRGGNRELGKRDGHGEIRKERKKVRARKEDSSRGSTLQVLD